MFRFLNRREARKLIAEKDIDVDLDRFFIAEREGSFYVVTRDVEKINLNDYRIVSMGLKVL